MVLRVYFKLWFSKSSKLLLDQHASKQFNFEANWVSKNFNLNAVQIFSKQIFIEGVASRLYTIEQIVYNFTCC